MNVILDAKTRVRQIFEGAPGGMCRVHRGKDRMPKLLENQGQKARRSRFIVQHAAPGGADRSTHFARAKN